MIISLIKVCQNYIVPITKNETITYTNSRQNNMRSKCLLNDFRLSTFRKTISSQFTLQGMNDCCNPNKQITFFKQIVGYLTTPNYPFGLNILTRYKINILIKNLPPYWCVICIYKNTRIRMNRDASNILYTDKSGQLDEQYFLMFQ